jgi:hypothetical protein
MDELAASARMLSLEHPAKQWECQRAGPVRSLVVLRSYTHVEVPAMLAAEDHWLSSTKPGSFKPGGEDRVARRRYVQLLQDPLNHVSLPGD